MLTPKALRWATAAAILTLLPPSAIAASGGVFEPSQGASEPVASRSLAVGASVRHDRQTPIAEGPTRSSSPLALGTQVLFVAGRSKGVRFRVNLRDGTLSTPSAPRLLEGVVDVVVAERLLWLCQADSSIGSGLNIVGFDLETGVRIHDAGREARVTSIAATFCPQARQRQRPQPAVSARLPII